MYDLRESSVLNDFYIDSAPESVDGLFGRLARLPLTFVEGIREGCSWIAQRSRRNRLQKAADVALREVADLDSLIAELQARRASLDCDALRLGWLAARRTYARR
jgi:hypothetical protein